MSILMSIPLIYQDIRPQDIYIPVGTKEVVRTEQIWIESIDILSELCHISKNLWNEANYVVRQLFTEKDKDGNRIGQYMKYSDLDYLIKGKSENYRKLNGAISQQILKVLDRSWKSRKILQNISEDLSYLDIRLKMENFYWYSQISK